MYYLPRCAAEAPYGSHFDELHEWTYHQSRHQAAVHGAQKVVDSSFPRSAGWQVRDVQEQTRKFSQDQRKAEIGRENRKLVDRLQKISTGARPADPRGPPPSSAPPNGPPGPRTMLRPSSAATLLVAPGELPPELPRSLNEPLRRKTQKCIEQDNIGLVRRILGTRSTFDRGREAGDFARHQRNVQLLHRLPEPGRQAGQRQLQLLPPLGPRKTALARELDGSLFFVADLHCRAMERSASAPAVGNLSDALPGSLPQEEAPEWGMAQASDEEPSSQEEEEEEQPEWAAPAEGAAPWPPEQEEEQLERTLPAGAPAGAPGMAAPEEASPEEEEALEEVVAPQAAPEEGEVVPEAAAPEAPRDPAQSWGARNFDEETERRRWSEEEALVQQDVAPQHAEHEAQGERSLGLVSDVSYREDWDDASMTGEWSPSAARTRTGHGGTETREQLAPLAEPSGDAP